MLLWALALWLMLGGFGCGPYGEGTVLLVELRPSGGGPALAEGDVLRVTTRYDNVHFKLLELPPPPSLRLGLRTPPGYVGPVAVSVLRLDGQECPTAQGQVMALVDGEEVIEVPLQLRLSACEDPAPAPANALADLRVGEVPFDVRARFAAEGSGPAPQLLYPYDRTLTAPQLHRMRVQWSGAQSLYRVLIAGPGLSLRAFVDCPGGRGCSLDLPDALWQQLALGNRDEELRVTVTGAGEAGGVGQGASAEARVRVAPSDLRGGLYYFSPSTKGLKRVPIGARQPTDFLAGGGGSGCAGCHALSRDGRLVALELGGADTSVGSVVVDAGDPSQRSFPASRDTAWNFASFDPSGEILVTAWQGALALRDARTGQKRMDVPAALLGGVGATMPEWSPDGKWIAFVRMKKASRDFALEDSGDIALVPYQDGALGPAVTLVPGKAGDEVHAWPSWSPDSRWLVFSSQRCGGRVCQQYDAKATRLRLVQAVRADGQPTAPADPAPAGAALPAPLELLLGTHAPDQHNNWPRFAPFLQMGRRGQRLAFVAFNSRAGFGHQAGGTPQLYLFAVDLAVAEAGGADPSFAPLWLPFQDAGTANHSAIWTTDVACQKPADCPAEFGCVAGVCTPVLG